MTSASSAIPQYLDAVRLARRSKNTLRTYRQALSTFARIIGKDDELSEKNYIKFLQKTSSESPRAQLTYRVPVARLYAYHAPEIPVKILTERYGQKKTKGLIQYNEDGLEKLISYAERMSGDLLTLRDRAFILTLADTGLRISEACSLTRSSIDWKRERAIIVGKGDKKAVVRFSPRSLEALRRYLSARSEMDGKSGKSLGSLPLFARHDPGAGKKIKPCSPQGMRLAFNLRAMEAGIEEKDLEEAGPVTPHKLRHSFVTRILRETGDPVKAKILARHEDINTTMQYTHLSEDEIDSTYSEIFGKVP